MLGNHAHVLAEAAWHTTADGRRAFISYSLASMTPQGFGFCGGDGYKPTYGCFGKGPRDAARVRTSALVFLHLARRKHGGRSEVARVSYVPLCETFSSNRAPPYSAASLLPIATPAAHDASPDNATLLPHAGGYLTLPAEDEKLCPHSSDIAKQVLLRSAQRSQDDSVSPQLKQQPPWMSQVAVSELLQWPVRRPRGPPNN